MAVETRDGTSYVVLRWSGGDARDVLGGMIAKAPGGWSVFAQPRQAEFFPEPDFVAAVQFLKESFETTAKLKARLAGGRVTVAFVGESPEPI